MAAMQSLVAQASRKWPDGIPEVVLSFGAADSAYFAQWLQRAISKAKGFTSDAVQCYLDTFAGQREAGTCLTIMPFLQGAQRAVRGAEIKGWNQGGMVGQLLRGRRAAQQAPSNAIGGAVASRNAAWDANYNLAVNVCHTMIFVVTPAWLNSAFCLQELNQFMGAAESRKGSKQPLNGIAVTFPKEFPGAYSKFIGTGITQAAGQNVVPIQEFQTTRESSIPNAAFETPTSLVHQVRKFGPLAPGQNPEFQRNVIQGPQGQQYQIPSMDLNRLVSKIP